MRTTIDLPEDLHQAVTSIAVHARKSMNQTVAELIRRGLMQPGSPATTAPGQALRIDPHTGLPLIRSPRPVSDEDVRALEDGGGRLASFDKGLVALHPDVGEAVPT